MIELHYGKETKVDYTPSGAAVEAGDPIVLGSVLCYPSVKIEDGKKGSVNWPSGTAVCKLTNSGVAFTAGDQVSYHTTNKNAVANGTSGSTHFGICVKDAATTDDVLVMHQLNATVMET